MAIKPKNKVSTQFSMSGMTDIVFLLLIFFMVTSTMINPNALKLLLPQSDNQVSGKRSTTVSITKDLRFYVEDREVNIADLEINLQDKLMNSKEPVVSLHVDKSVPMEQVVRVMNIAKNNKYKLVLATSPVRK
jgi:biopolymer transport protein ExbD